jgi:hypothetical protein
MLATPLRQLTRDSVDAAAAEVADLIEMCMQGKYAFGEYSEYGALAKILEKLEFEDSDEPTTPVTTACGQAVQGQPQDGTTSR